MRVVENEDGTWPYDEEWIPRPGAVELMKVIGGCIHKHVGITVPVGLAYPGAPGPA